MFKKWLDILARVELFETIEEHDLEDMLICLKPKLVQYKKGETVAIAGDPFKGVGIVLEGEVLIAKENAVGNRVILNKMPAGNIFGEMIAFSHIPAWPATIFVTDHATIMFIEPNRIVSSCGQQCDCHTILILNMLKIVSKRALLLNRKVEYLAIKSMREKIAAYLMEQYKQCQKNTFMIPLNRNEMADFLNVSRPSMSRELAKMKDEGMIDYYKSSFKIIDKDGLINCIS